MKIKVSINRQHKGKPDQKRIERLLEKEALELGISPTKLFWRKFNGGFRNKYIPITELMAEIKEGHTFSTMVKGYRKKENFICGQHIGLDFDTEDYLSSFDGLMDNDHIRKYAHFFYTTHSHTREAPKSRVVFVLPEPIYNKSLYAELAEMTVRWFGVNDTQCNDPCRIFFGAVDCEFKFLGNVLPIEVARELFVEPMKLRIQEDRQKKIDAMRLAMSSGYSANGYDNRTALQSMVAKFASAPDGEKHSTLCQVSYTLGGYIASGMDEQDVTTQLGAAIYSHPTVQDRGAAFRTMVQCIERGKQRPLEVPIAEPFAKYLGINIKKVTK
jgi:hypothetical protein